MPENRQAKKVTSKNGIGNFWGFWVFDFGPYTEIEISENSEIFTALVMSKECVLLGEVGNVRVFRVFDFGIKLKSKSRKTRKYLQHL